MDIKTDNQQLAERFKKGWPLCDSCQKAIPLERLEVLPETTTCVKHSKEGAYVGFPVYSHKTAPEVAKVKSHNTESLRQLKRGYFRSR